jgi:hypothetical protein
MTVFFKPLLKRGSLLKIRIFIKPSTALLRTWAAMEGQVARDSWKVITFGPQEDC